MDNKLYTNILQICRTCLKEITDTSFFYLDCIPSANSQLTIRQTLYRCVPELDLNIVPNAVMCRKCIDNLLSALEFKKNCLESEMLINKYIQQEQYTGDLNLVEVVQFHQPDITKVKMEDLEITEDFNVFNEASACADATEPQYLLELQKVEMEDGLFNTFDDYNVSYNLSTAEEHPDTKNSNIAQNCLPEVIEHDHNYSNNLNKTNQCGHKAESKLKLILPLKHHIRKNFYHEEIISRKISTYRKSLICYYRCSLCKYITKYKSLFDFHIRIHLIKKNYKHSVKLRNVHTKAFLTIMEVNKRKRVKNCNNYYKSKFKNGSKSKKSKQHLNHHNSLKPSNIRAHIVEKLFKCSICEYQFNFKSNLRRHMRIHTGEKPYSCSICEYRCSQKYPLKKHMRIHTGEKPFTCFVCEYRCSQKSHLKKHMPIHTGEKPFTCSVCKYQCSQKSNLKTHMRIHTGEKPFSCSICKFKCSHKSNLNTLKPSNIRAHIVEKLFKCSICEYQSNFKSNIRRHMRIHTGEKPYSCSVCEYRCSQISNLKKHMLIHTGEKPFICSVCKYQCNQKGNLKTICEFIQERNHSRVPFANSSVAIKVT